MIEIEKETKLKKQGNHLFQFPNQYVVVDIETSGLSPTYHEIIEIAAIKVKENRIVEEWKSLIKPNQPVNYFITNLTGITNQMLKKAPCLPEVLSQFKEFIEEEILVGHNIKFDLSFLSNRFETELQQPLPNDFVDTMKLARKLLPDLKHHKLETLTKYYEIQLDNAHRALADCQMTKNLLDQLKQEAVRKYGSYQEFR